MRTIQIIKHPRDENFFIATENGEAITGKMSRNTAQRFDAIIEGRQRGSWLDFYEKKYPKIANVEWKE